jgi:curved DNA-binding protein CbpA
MGRRFFAMATKRDFYEILELPKTCNAEELKKAYRKKAVQFHPDKIPVAHTAWLLHTLRPYSSLFF